MKSTMANITSGRASIRIGIAFRMPSASPSINCNAASRIIGRFSINVSTIWMTTSTIAGISSGSASAMPFAKVTITSRAAFMIIGRLASSPLIKTVTSCNALDVSLGKSLMIASMNVCINFSAALMIVSRLSTIAFASVTMMFPNKSMIEGTYFMMTSIAFGNMSPKTSAILEMSPFASWMPFVNSPSSPTPSLVKSVNIGKRTEPSAFLRAVVPLLSSCNWSSNAP